MKIKIKNQNLVLDHNKVLFWKEQRILILSDLHLGKSETFNKSGIALPDIIEKELQKLQKVIDLYIPKKIIIIGDLFHAEYNKEWEIFKSFIKKNKEIDFELVIGNHDRVNIEKIYTLGLKTTEDILRYDPFVFIHNPFDIPGISFENKTYKPNKDAFYITGHIHPGIKLKGKGKQSLSLQCFFIKQNILILPSFGAFTGRYLLKPESKDKIYFVVENSVVKAHLE